MSITARHRLLLAMIAIAAATASGIAVVSGRSATRVVPVEPDAPAARPSTLTALPVVALDEPAPSTEHLVSSAHRSDVAPSVVESTSPLPTRVAKANASRTSNAGESFVAALPQPLLELARTTAWDEHSSAALERFMAATFDADDDGTLDDFERIVAVRALREAMWSAAPDETSDRGQEPVGDDEGQAAPATLSSQERRLHHDVDERRRREHEEHGGGAIDDDLRVAIALRFQLDDDGRVSVAELARYLHHRRNGSAAADLNGDGQADDSDLRLFLDVASPIDEP